jgi:hypothetical protein
MALKMRQSHTELEQAFAQEISLERRRRHSLLRSAEQRTLKRRVERDRKLGSIRFALLVAALIATAAMVTAVMFRTLYMLLG